MGLRRHELEILMALLPVDSVLSLGYPDLVMTQDELEALAGFRTRTTNNRGASWHGVNGELPETAEVFKRLGVGTFRCIDSTPSRDIEEVADLNYPTVFGAYDLVIDAGTTEHCFNIGQAILNAANSVKVGGHVYHAPPLTAVNHGFYCPQPALFHDFYTQNGWEIVRLAALGRGGMKDISGINRLRADPDIWFSVVAKRTSAAKLRFPTQSKYLMNPTLSGENAA